MFGILGKRTNKFGREPIVVFGMVIHFVCFLLIYFNLPDTSPVDNTLLTGKVFKPPR